MSTMDEPPLSEIEVIRFLENRGGRCTNYDLVSNFRGILNDPNHQAEARLRFKDIINRVAAVVEYQNIKYIELKKEYDYNTTKQDPQSYGHTSLPFDSSATSGYTSPLTQNFQPYWRYRLSTNPQMPPSRKAELESALRSTKSKSLDCSISESPLPDGRVHHPRTPSNRTPPQTTNVRVRQSHSLSGDEKMHPSHLSTESLPYELNRNSNPLSGIVGSGRLSNESLSSRESVVRSRTLSRDVSSLSTESWLSGRHPQYGSSGYASTESGSRESVRHSLSSLRDERRSPAHSSTHSWPEEFRYHQESTECRSPLNYPTNNDAVKSNSLPFFDLPNGLPCATQYAQNSNLNKPIYQNSDYVRRLSGVGCEEKDVDSWHVDRNCHPSRNGSKIHQTNERSRIGSFENKKMSHRSISMVDNVEDKDIFSDPNYFRSVSKLCLPKNKSLSAINLPERIDNRPVTQSRNNTSATVKDRSSMNDIKRSAEDTDKIPPQPPERRSQDSSLPAVVEKIEETPGSAVIEEKISGKVKDKVQHFLEMEKKQKRSFGGKENRPPEKSSSLDDDISISVLDPKLKKEWFVKSSQCDYHSLVSLLKKEPKLAALKTALHWAAKHGDANVVKLIAGSYKISPNIRSGYTPLHLSSLYRHHMIGHLLIHTYGADPSIRDYYGKKADQYPDNYVRKVAGSKNIERRPVKQRPAKQTNSFMRIGSLNLRKARKSTVFASVRGHAEMRFGNFDSIGKRINRKENLYSGRNCIEEDTDVAFSSKKQET
ncbi:ankyrin repeat domain-containing protein SOWAHB [Parasteatoda tepidariorum]|uniref:ankyrin repeat domain-containing protein SOWAHB n=1 Tax=Parasteatoda tepidariorum TaxID=114398 RepID=UPI0039BD305C